MASLNLWYIQDLARFRQENLALAALAAGADWLDVGPHRLDADGCVVVDFTLTVVPRTYEARLRYPTIFPHSPPIVGSRDGSTGWSTHQYNNGDLCLEYRPDNWSTEILAADVVASAYRLLAGENPAPGVRAEVPSAHVLSEGQRLRGTASRLVLTHKTDALLGDLVPGQGFNAIAKRFSFSISGMVRVIAQAVLPNGTAWEDATLPVGEYGDIFDEPTHVRSLTEAETFPVDLAYEPFVAAMEALGVPAEAAVVVLIKGTGVQAYRFNQQEVFSVGVVAAPTTRQRLTAAHATLSLKQVAIIGCGSVGSKVATSLARCGVRSFVLVDDDVLAPDNLIRNDLDWRSVGRHKVDALATRLDLVQPGMAVTKRRNKLGGQESATTSESVIASIARADLIVDATGVAETGNLLNALRPNVAAPIVWGEVFAGGIGGLIARQRPGVEPSIPLMRRAIENWFVDNDVPSADVLQPAEPYALQHGDRVFVADDADVSTVASALTRLAVDTLLARDPSHFASSLYLIGMAPEGPFTQAFNTHPIALPPVDETQPTHVMTKAENDEAIAMLGAMVERGILG